MIYRKILFILLQLCFYSANAEEKSILILGDSLSAAYGIPLESGWVSLLKKHLSGEGYPFKVVNASISGETILGVTSRLDELLKKNRPDIVIVELGGNDGLRGFPLFEIEQNLKKIVRELKLCGSQVLLIPMRLPPNYGDAYNRRFQDIYEQVARELNITLSEFILKDIAQHAELMQSDGIHPVEKAQQKMLENIWPSLQVLLH